MNAYDLYTFYIEPADLKGQAHKVKVEGVEVADVFDPRRKRAEKKIILRLSGKKKVLGMNKTRTKQMIELAGTPEIEQWIGAEIAIEPAKQSGKDTIFIKLPQQSQPRDVTPAPSAPEWEGTPEEWSEPHNEPATFEAPDPEAEAKYNEAKQVIVKVQGEEKFLSELTKEQLQYVIDKSMKQTNADAAKIVLEYKNRYEMQQAALI